MGLRFWKRIRLFPGVALNLGTGGASVSLGGNGASLNVGPRGTRVSLGIPGTGIYWTQQLTGGAPWPAAPARPPPAARPRRDRAPAAPVDVFARALDALDADRPAEAYNGLRGIDHPDACFLLGLLLLDHDQQPEEAARRLLRAADEHDTLGDLFAEVDRPCTLDIELAPDEHVVITPDRLGAELALAEALQRVGRAHEAVRRLRALPDHPLVRRSLEDLVADPR